MWGMILVSVFQSREVPQYGDRNVQYRNNSGLWPLVRIMEVSVIGGVRCQRFHCSLPFIRFWVYSFRWISLIIIIYHSPLSFSDQDLIFQCSCPDHCRVLHLQFTHRNCLHAIATVASDASTHTNVEPMDTTSVIGFQGSSLPAFQQIPMLTSLQPGTILPFD